MYANILARLKALEQKAKNDTAVYFVTMTNGLYCVDGCYYSPQKFTEWCGLHENSIVILDDIGELPTQA